MNLMDEAFKNYALFLIEEGKRGAALEMIKELQALEPDANGVRRAYRVEGGIPVLLVDEARTIED